MNRWWPFNLEMFDYDIDHPAIYELGDAEQNVVYIGSANRLKARLLEHMNDEGIKTHAVFYRFVHRKDDIESLAQRRLLAYHYLHERLPLCNPPETRLTGGEPSRMATRVLVVDDEADIKPLFRQRLRRRIRAGKLELSFARNGRQALDVLRSDPELRIVLTDINMPEMDGLALLSHLQELGRRIQVVIMSAYGDMKNIRTAMNRGAFDFLTKPLDFADLETTLDKTLEQVRTFLEAEESRRQAVELEGRNRSIREIFGRYVTQDIVDRLLDSPEGFRLGGEKRHVTVLVAEVKGFTALSERLAPEDVVRMLNRWFEAMFDVAADHGGAISDVGGAGCHVLFGAPLAMERGARRALECALVMRTKLERLNETAGDGTFPLIEMGVGVHTGAAVIGNVGSVRRARYGAVGSEVNLAARIESYATAGQILISDATLREAGGGIRVDGTMDLHPRGIERRVTVHDLAGLEEV